MRGPTSPVCRLEVRCIEPARGAMLSFDSIDRDQTQTLMVGGVPGTVAAGSALVAKDGTYSVSLPPGVYTVN
jgi:hypothetical protein